MTPEELKSRLKTFALDILRLAEEMPHNRTAETLVNQLLRAGTSVGTNYRSACRAQSRADFISKITIVEEETDESRYWLEILDESGIVKRERLTTLLAEAGELTAIFASSGKTAKGNR